MPLLEQHRKELEHRIVDTMITALEKNEVSEDELTDIAGFVLERIDTLGNEDQAAEFLTELSAKWGFFKPILVLELGKVKSEVEKKIARDVLSLANSGNIEEAIRLAKTMTEQINK